jgi:hypothetical protein
MKQSLTSYGNVAGYIFVIRGMGQQMTKMSSAGHRGGPAEVGGWMHLNQ